MKEEEKLPPKHSQSQPMEVMPPESLKKEEESASNNNKESQQPLSQPMAEVLTQMISPAKRKGKPRLMIERLELENFKSYAGLKTIGPFHKYFTSVVGPNGSGKSTLFDVFAFLSECFGVGLRKAWDKRGRFKELRTRGVDGPIIFEVKYREKKASPLITYHLEIDETQKGHLWHANF